MNWVWVEDKKDKKYYSGAFHSSTKMIKLPSIELRKVVDEACLEGRQWTSVFINVRFFTVY